MASTVNFTVVDHHGQPWKLDRRWVAYFSHHHRHFLLRAFTVVEAAFAPRAGQKKGVLTVEGMAAKMPVLPCFFWTKLPTT